MAAVLEQLAQRLSALEAWASGVNQIRPNRGPEEAAEEADRLREQGGASAQAAPPAPHEIDAGGCAAGTSEGAPAEGTKPVFDESAGATLGSGSGLAASVRDRHVVVTLSGLAEVYLKPPQALVLARELEICADQAEW